MSARTIVRLMGVQRAQRTESYSAWVTDEYLNRCKQTNAINGELVKNVRDQNRKKCKRVASLRIERAKAYTYVVYS
jgi:uncharacterized protein CbrC (UPF0167 family)